MSEREKLIELIGKAKCYGHETFADRFVKSYLERLADQLLENGVIVPPVKVGQTVYGISRGVIIPISVDRIGYSKRGIDIVGSNEMCFGYGTITLHPDNKFGIEWYTTKEQAEKHCKEVRSDG